MKSQEKAYEARLTIELEDKDQLTLEEVAAAGEKNGPEIPGNDDGLPF
ncbi:hypothetical protein [Paenibacillus etheri]|nr:hypothetical protein [Paenibacillus etheri]